MDGKPLPGKLETLALALAQGASVRKAAKLAGLAESTARGKAADPALRHRVTNLREQILSQAVGKLSRLALRACTAYEQLLSGKSDSETRLKAARGVFADLTMMRESLDIVTRLEALEDRHAKPSH